MLLRQRACQALIVTGLFASQSVAAAGMFQCESDNKMLIRDPSCAAINVVKPQRRQQLMPPAAAPKGSDAAPPANRKSWVDPQRDAKLLKGRMERALSHRAQDTAKWRNATPGCRDLVEQIAREQPGVHSLRAETRARARERMGLLSKTFEERGC